MMKKYLPVIKNISVTILILVAGFILGLLIQNQFEDDALIPAITVLGVFLISVLTDGYIYGVAASFFSVLALNYAFTFPYFKINFTIPENTVSALIMIAITLITCGITNKIKYQEAIKEEGEREKMRANLLRAVSHDLRTPLTTICGASSALLENENEFTPQQRAKMLMGIQQDAQWLYRMVENLLSITRLDGNHVKIIKSPIVLEELVDSVLLKFNKRHGEQEITVDIPEELVVILADGILIEQVLMNLLENALQHATGMSRICLRVYTRGSRAVFEIEDNGCGIPKERLAHIFSGTYDMEENGADSSRNNAGIGLSVCETIIKAHGGGITARNVAGGGALFCFTLEREIEVLDESEQI